MEPANIGATILQRRRAFALSEDDVAEFSGLPVEAVREVEQGRHEPTPFELSRLANALAMDPSALWRGDAGLDDPARGTARFLAGYGLSGLSARDYRLLAKAAEIGRIGHFLWSMLGRKQSLLMKRRTITPLDLAVEPWEQGYALAEQDRLASAPSRAPLPSVQGFLEENGVHVAFVDFETADVVAASLAEPNALPVILLNRRHSRVKNVHGRRSVLAHELGHLLHDATTQNIVSVVSRRTQKWEPWEQRANGFAPNFLAPSSWVKVEAGEPSAIVGDLATTWLLSWEGACWHAKNLRLITPSACKDLMSRPRGGVADVSDETVPRTPLEMLGLDVDEGPLPSGLVSELVAAAVSEGEISEGRAMEILSIR